MIRNLSTLYSSLHYVPDSVYRLQANAFKRMKYKIRTIHGTSTQTYINSTEIPIHGQEQGIYSAGTTLAFHSIPMMRVIEKSCSGCVMSSPNKLYQLEKHILGFVDDKRQYSNDWNEHKIATITTQLKHAAQSWEHLLYTTGGKLEISKYGTYIMEWTFHDDGRVILAPMSDVEPFTITSSFDKSHYVMTLLSNNECMKYLGIQSAPSGNQDSQFHSSITTAKLGARTLDTNPFGRYHAKLYLNTHLNPKIYFLFTCSSLSNQQYIDINKEHIPSALSTMGFNRTWPLSLR